MPDPIDVYVGSRIRLRRTLLGHTQQKLAAALGLTFQQVQKYERGTNRVGSSRLVHIANFLEVHPAWFFAEMPDEIAGFGKKGMSEDAEPFEADKTMLRRETLELVRIMEQMEDPDTRKALVNLINELGAIKD